MKLKYKKIIMLTTMSTMGIGLLTLSISQDSSKAEESINLGAGYETGLLSANDDSDSYKVDGVENKLEATAAPTPSPTPIPTPTPLPIYELEEDAYPEINALFDDYYTAKSSCDIEKLKSMLSDPTKVETVEDLQKKTNYIDDYRNIKVYTKRGFEDESFIVYVYHEVKFTGVKTLAPSLAKLYLITDEGGNLKIFSGKMPEELKAYYIARREDADVKKLMTETETKYEAAKAKDEDLYNYCVEIENKAKLENKNPFDGETIE